MASREQLLNMVLTEAIEGVLDCCYIPGTPEYEMLQEALAQAEPFARKVSDADISPPFVLR